MTIFWIVWVCFIFGMLMLANIIETDAVRKRINGGNGMILVSSCFMTILTAPVPFIVTWVWVDFLTAVLACAIGGIAYAAAFTAVLNRLGRLARSSS